ncbi:MAG: serine hydrolase, partial [Pirellulaceae bacterium]
MKPARRAFLFVVLTFCALIQSASLQAQTDSQLAAIDQYLAQAHIDWQVPGFAVAIVKDDQVIFSKGYGVREMESTHPVDGDTLFAIASNTKAFTAAALAILVDEGVISWDDRVRDHLPYFELHDPYTTEDMRIRDLLCHRSGLGTYSGDLMWYGTAYSPRQVLERVEHLPQAGPFGRSYGYSNLMFLAAGELIAAKAGVDWQFFIKNRLLEPLGMNRTVTSTADLEGMENVATPHKTSLTGNKKLAWFNWDSMAAAGGIISSVNDMTRWLRTQLKHGAIDDNNRLFSAAASQEMWRPHTLINISEAYQSKNPSTHFRAYGLGWSMRDYKGRKVLSHGGGYDGMYSRVVLVPEENIGMVVLTNSMTWLPTVACNRILDEFLGGDKKDWSSLMLGEFQDDRRKFQQRISDATTAQLPDTKPSRDLNHYAGTYVDAMYGDATVKLEDGNLVLNFAVNPDLTADLIHLHLNTFRVDWRKEFAWFGAGNIQFDLDSKAQVTGFQLDIPNDDLWF